MSLFKGLISTSEDDLDWFPGEKKLAGDSHPGTVRIREYPESQEELTGCTQGRLRVGSSGALVPHPAGAPSTMPERL